MNGSMQARRVAWCGMLAMFAHFAAMAAAPEETKTESKGPPKAEVPVSDASNYRGDCLHLTTKLNGAPEKVQKLYVVSQAGTSLKVVAAEKDDWWEEYWPHCRPADNTYDQTPSTVEVGDVISSGARRSGWVYGMLVAPFKYYPHSHELVASSTIGPYLGWRMEKFGGTTTGLFSAGISSVPVHVPVTEAGQEAKTVPAMAWSVAAGAIFEVSKGKNPFRIGALVGKDFVGRKDGVRYDNSGHPWVALQLGYDLTDH